MNSFPRSTLLENQHLNALPLGLGARLLIALILLLTAGIAQAAEIYVDGVACQLSDAITAANTDEAIYGCAAGAGADTLILTRDIQLQLGSLPSITSDISIEFFNIASQVEDCNEDNKEPTDEPSVNATTSGNPTATDEPTATDRPTATDEPPPNATSPGSTPFRTGLTPDPTDDPTIGDPKLTGTVNALLTATASAALSETPTATGTLSATPPTSSAQSAVPEHCLHIVVRNETLYRIALEYDMTVRQFSSINGLQSVDTLYEDQVLIVPYEDCVQYASLKG